MSTEDAPRLPPNAARLPMTPQLHALLTIIRNKDTPRSDFIFYSDRIIRLLVEEGLNHLPVLEQSVTTPTGHTYTGVAFQGRICGVSILRAGEAMESGLRECCRSVRIGKILYDEETARPKLFYAKLPEDIADRWVLLLDPMLATGGSAIQAIKVLVDHGVRLDRILFLNMIASPEGLESVWKAYPEVRVISAWVDAKLSDQNYILPGLGDYGDRYYSG
ncbi:uracil phosphoribosyltransferase [Malassezia brasiliensis]|uniref:uracil phosphoribosyltransferase n=1 Tax=Malassezia brasiliensis TaxID=1821822 RepID=A0AAF0IPD5_9BASI|nr:uracil phosphoribosyltransferase [Malassezia brasiliensis]